MSEIIDESAPFLEESIDPKLAYALRHPELFPVDVNTAPLEMILRIPGVGVKTARLIVQSRRYGKVRMEDVKKMGAAMNRARYFMTAGLMPLPAASASPKQIRAALLSPSPNRQLSLFS
jgi:predicted DNA-binding helix-hairpin-helix protein